MTKKMRIGLLFTTKKIGQKFKIESETLKHGGTLAVALPFDLITNISRGDYFIILQNQTGKDLNVSSRIYGGN